MGEHKTGVPAWDPPARALRAIEAIAQERGVFVGYDAHAALDARIAVDRDGLTQLLTMVLARAVLDADAGASLALVAARGPADRIRYEVRGAEKPARRDIAERLAGRHGVVLQDGPPPAVEVAIAGHAPNAFAAAGGFPEGAVPAGPGGADGGRRLVLCIEDNPVHTRLLADVLARRPQVDAVFAGDAMTGMRLALQRNPDLVVLDLQVADVSGMVVLEHVRAHPATAGTPVVILSADVRPGREGEVLRAGANAFLGKPVDVGELLATVDRLLVR